MRIALGYSIIFLVVGFLNSIEISRFIYYSHENFLQFIIYYALPSIIFSVRILRKNVKTYRLVKIKIIYYAWILMVIIDFIMAWQIPILNVIFSQGVYTDFKPPMHGLTNALSLVYMCSLPFEKEEKKWIKVLQIVGYQLIILNRGPAMYHLIAYFAGYFIMSYNKGGVSSIIKKLFISVTLIGGSFGLIGKLRSAEVEVITEIFGVNTNFEWLPDGVIWIVIYFTSPFSNLLFNLSLDNVDCPSGSSSLMSTLLPGFLRNSTLGHDVTVGFNLPCETTGLLFYPGLNVSTGFVQYYIDFGMWGLTLFAFILSFAFKRIDANGCKNWDSVSSLIFVLLFVNIFAPSFNQLSFVAASIIMLMFSKKNET